MTDHASSLGAWGWLVLLSKATMITLRLIFKAIKALLYDPKNGLTFHQRIGYEAVRDYQVGLDAVGIQNLRPTTSKTCVSFARKHRINQSEVQLPGRTIAQWLGPRKASKIIVFFHGGGYMSPILNEQLSLAFGFTAPSQTDFAVVVLQYDLASENANHYPRQLQQAVSLVEYLLYSESTPPSAITLMGESAGAHLLLSLILHIGHPNPLVSPLSLKGRFSDAILISPWVDMNTSTESIQSNKDKDVLSPAALSYWARNFLGGAAPDFWNAPLLVPAEWWGDLPVDQILVLYGDDELIRDDTSMFCEKLKVGHVHTTVLKFSGEIHGHMVMNRFLGINAPCESEKALVSWMKENLGS